MAHPRVHARMPFHQRWLSACACIRVSGACYLLNQSIEPLVGSAFSQSSWPGRPAPMNLKWKAYMHTVLPYSPGPAACMQTVCIYCRSTKGKLSCRNLAGRQGQGSWCWSVAVPPGCSPGPAALASTRGICRPPRRCCRALQLLSHSWTCDVITELLRRQIN